MTALTGAHVDAGSGANSPRANGRELAGGVARSRKYCSILRWMSPMKHKQSVRLAQRATIYGSQTTRLANREPVGRRDVVNVSSRRWQSFESAHGRVQT